MSKNPYYQQALQRGSANAIQAEVEKLGKCKYGFHLQGVLVNIFLNVCAASIY